MGAWVCMQAKPSECARADVRRSVHVCVMGTGTRRVGDVRDLCLSRAYEVLDDVDMSRTCRTWALRVLNAVVANG